MCSLCLLMFVGVGLTLLEVFVGLVLLILIVAVGCLYILVVVSRALKILLVGLVLQGVLLFCVGLVALSEHRGRGGGK